MIRVVNLDDVYVFDEIGWGDTKFEGHDLAKKLLIEHAKDIRQIEFFSVEQAIAIRVESTLGEIDHWFHDIDADLLCFLCQLPQLRKAVKHYFIRAHMKSFSVEKYPLLAATLLGNNNED